MSHEKNLEEQKKALMPLVMKGIDSIPTEAGKWDSVKTRRFLDWNKKARQIMNRSRLSVSMMAKINAEAAEWHAGTVIAADLPKQADFIEG